MVPTSQLPTPFWSTRVLWGHRTQPCAAAPLPAAAFGKRFLPSHPTPPAPKRGDAHPKADTNPFQGTNCPSAEEAAQGKPIRAFTRVPIRAALNRSSSPCLQPPQIAARFSSAGCGCPAPRGCSSASPWRWDFQQTALNWPCASSSAGY